MTSRPHCKSSVPALLFAIGNLWLGACDGPLPDTSQAPEAVGQLVSELHRPRLGDPLRGLTDDQRKLFELGEDEFERVLLPRDGLGPVYVERSCVACHALGATGGADPLRDPNHFVRRFGTLTMGRYDPLAALGGDVQQTRSITPIQPFCNVAPEVVPPQATVLSLRNPQPIFGDGLIDAITDATIVAGAVDKGDGVHGRPNLDPGGRPGRFGWKAQATTLVAFTAGAALGTLGLTTPLVTAEPLPQGNPIPAGCTNTDVGASTPNDASGAILFSITAWEALLAPPEAQPLDREAQKGQRLFHSVGCAKCHVSELTTGTYDLALRDGRTVRVDALSGKTARLYSDLLLHDMGPGLDEKVEMRQAKGSEFRTAPLWGLRHRVRYLHDGRADTLHEAIVAHGGEAQIIRARYQALRDPEQHALRDFLRSL